MVCLFDLHVIVEVCDFKLDNHLLHVHCASPIDDCAIFGYSLHCYIKRAVVERILFYFYYVYLLLVL